MSPSLPLNPAIVIGWRWNAASSPNLVTAGLEEEVRKLGGRLEGRGVVRRSPARVVLLLDRLLMFSIFLSGQVRKVGILVLNSAAVICVVSRTFLGSKAVLLTDSVVLVTVAAVVERSWFLVITTSPLTSITVILTTEPI